MRKKWLGKEKGQALEIVMGLMMLVVLIILFLFSFRMKVIRQTSNNSETTLTSSLLAGAIIDTEIYGMSHNSVVTDFDKSRDAFLGALKVNYNLNSENIPSTAGSVIISGITVHDFSVWSIYDRNKNGVFDGVEIWKYQSNAVPPKPTTEIESTILYDKDKDVDHQYYDLLTAELGLAQTGNDATSELLKAPSKMSEAQWIAYRKFMGKYEDPLTGLPADDNWEMSPSSYTDSTEWDKVKSSANLVRDQIEYKLKTPTDVTIETTTLYGDIGFWIGGVGWDSGVNIFSSNPVSKDKYYIHIIKSVDIINEEELDWT